MRVYTDRFTDRGRTQIYLMVADAVTIATAITFVAGAWSRPEYWPDTCCLAIWAVVPRLLVPYVRWLRHARSFGETLAYALVLVVFSGLLSAGGVDLVWFGLPGEHQPSFYSVVMIFGLWTSTFFLFHPPWYRVHDIVLVGTLLMGLIDRQPYPLVAIALLFVSFGVSAAVRHLLYNIYLDVRKPLINLQNARVAAGISAVLYAAVFMALFHFFSLWVPYERPALEASGSKGVRPVDRLIAPTFATREAREGEGTAEPIGDDSDGDHKSPRTAGTPATRTSGAPDRAGSPQYRVGYTGDVRLTALDSDAENEALAVRIHVPSIADRARWAVDSGTLFRVATSVTPDDTGAHWAPVVRDPTHRWLKGTSLMGDSAGAPDEITAEIEILSPTIRFLVSPYRTSRYGPARRNREYRLTDTGNPVLTGGSVGDRYLVQFRPLSFDRLTIASRTRVATGRHLDPRTLQLPRELGFDARHSAALIFRDEVSIGGKIRALRRFYRSGGFQYAYNASWRTEGDRLVAFLDRYRVGDCNYFAVASAILLRAGGVSTRLATGFSGAELDIETGDYLLRQERSHAWTEYYLPSVGWIPIDPTTWVAAAAPSLAAGDPRPSSSGSADPLTSSRASSEDSQDLDPSQDEERTGTQRAIDPSAVGSKSGRDRSRPSRSSPIASTSKRDARDVDAPESMQPRESSVSQGSTAGTTDPSIGAADADGVRDPTMMATRQGRPGSALARLFILLCAGVLATVTVRRYLDPDLDEDDPEVESGPTTVSDPLGGWALSPPGFEPRDTNESAIYHYQDLQYALARARHHRKPHETPAQHAQRFRGRDAALDAAFDRLNRCLYAVLYASRTMTETDVAVVEESCRTIRRVLCR